MCGKDGAEKKSYFRTPNIKMSQLDICALMKDIYGKGGEGEVGKAGSCITKEDAHFR